jgi:hypothetical protein
MVEIIYKGYNISINEKLLEKQNVWHNLKGICKTRVSIQNLMKIAYLTIEEKKDTGWTPKEILKEIEELEYDLQYFWGFPQDRCFHSYQWGLPSCKCPVMDNRERIGTGTWIINRNCPYHGDINEI